MTTGERPPQTPTRTCGAHPAEAREEADEAAESLPSGTTGSCTGSGIRGGLLGGRGRQERGGEGRLPASRGQLREGGGSWWRRKSGSSGEGRRRRVSGSRGLTPGWRRRVWQAP